MALTRIPLFALAIIFAVLFAGNSSASVIFSTKSFTISLDDVEATFAPAVESSGIHGAIQVAKPLDACSPLVNKPKWGEGTVLPFALIKRGSCTFESKVRNAQAAGFSAAIIYNNDYSIILPEMSGNSEGITTHAVFISRAAGELLHKYSKDENLECQITPSSHYDISGWRWWLLYLFAMVIVYAIIYVAAQMSRRIHHTRNTMSSRQMRELPSLLFTSPADDKGTSETCVVCLEDYREGDKLCLLPCHHRFHAVCIESWLTKWKTFCPVCKRDVKTSLQEPQKPQASEQTPLLSSSPLLSSNISSSGAASTHSSPSESWVVHIPSTSPPSQSFTSPPSQSFSSSNSGSSLLQPVLGHSI